MPDSCRERTTTGERVVGAQPQRQHRDAFAGLWEGARALAHGLLKGAVMASKKYLMTVERLNRVPLGHGGMCER